MTQTTTFMGSILCPQPAEGQIRGRRDDRRRREEPRSATVAGLVRVLLIVNASASSVTARAQVVIAKALSADHEVEVAETSRRGHATRLARGRPPTASTSWSSSAATAR